jgi:hypothetical protein
VGRRGEELPHGVLERLDRESLVRLGDALDQVRNVAGQARERRAWSLSASALKGCSFALAGSAPAICFQRRKVNSACTYWGFSQHSVLSLSKVAIRSAGGT